MSEVELRKLALAKYIFLHGCNHAANKHEISRMLAIHHFDFAVEMVLKTIALKHGISFSPKQDVGFRELWNRITKKNVRLPLETEIFDLHYERNQVQHSGAIPSFEDVIRFRDVVESFLKKVIENEFNLSFDKLSLSQLIKNTQLRDLVQEAERLFENGKYEECILTCDEALINATFDVGKVFRKAGMLTRYFGAADELIRVIDRNYAEKYRNREFYSLAKDLSRAILQLGQATTGMQFLDEYRVKFIEFRKLIENLEHIPKEKLEEKARFALNFVIELILKWQEEGVINSFTSMEERR